MAHTGVFYRDETAPEDERYKWAMAECLPTAVAILERNAVIPERFEITKRDGFPDGIFEIVARDAE